MIASLLLPWIAAGPATTQGFYETLLSQIEPGSPKTMIRVLTEKASVTKLSPKKFGTPPVPWEFEWMVSGYGIPIGDDRYHLRVQVYSQEHKMEGDRAPLVARMLTRLWAYNYHHLKLDHAQQYNAGIVDVYLCYGGKAGGEQIFGVDYQFFKNPDQAHVNTIYFYDLQSFTSPMEMAREVAHEYGHATLPPVGGFKKPEDWANGYLGEKLFLSYARDRLADKKFESADVMGATLAQLNTWVKTNVDPLIAKVALNGPDLTQIGKTGPEAMNSYMGLALYAAKVLPESVFARSIQLTGSLSAKDFPAAVVNAAQEPKSYSLRVPLSLQGKAIWVPLKDGSVVGARVLLRKGSWVKVQPTAKTVTIRPHLTEVE